MRTSVVLWGFPKLSWPCPACPKPHGTCLGLPCGSPGKSQLYLVEKMKLRLTNCHFLSRLPISFCPLQKALLGQASAQESQEAASHLLSLPTRSSANKPQSRSMRTGSQALPTTVVLPQQKHPGKARAFLLCCQGTHSPSVCKGQRKEMLALRDVEDNNLCRPQETLGGRDLKKGATLPRKHTARACGTGSLATRSSKGRSRQSLGNKREERCSTKEAVRPAGENARA